MPKVMATLPALSRTNARAREQNYWQTANMAKPSEHG
jgi:hypothetical protein